MIHATELLNATKEHMSDKLKKQRSHRRFATLRSGLKLSNREDPEQKQPKEKVVLRRKSHTSQPEIQLRDVKPPSSPVIPRLRPVSANRASVSAQSSPKQEFSKNEIGNKEFLTKQRIHRQVEVEAYTYGFDVAYMDYLMRYNKVWAAIEILDTLQAYQLLRGVVRYADRIATCVTAFHQTMERIRGEPNAYKLMKRRLNAMLYMIKSVIIQTKTIQEVLVDIGETAEDDYASAFQIQVDKMDTTRANLEEVCQRITTKSIAATRTSAAMSIDEEIPRLPSSPMRRKYNNPTTKLALPKTTPRDKEVHEEHGDADLGSSEEYATSSDSTE